MLRLVGLFINYGSQYKELFKYTRSVIGIWKIKSVDTHKTSLAFM